MTNKRAPFRKSRLDNGMLLLTESVPQFQTLSMGVWVSAGTRHEQPGEEGLSHFLEHMMFKGTENRSALQIALEVDRVGGEFNAFTSREYTCFHILCLAKDLKLGAEILSDVLLNSKFDEEELERERRVILQEITMTEDNAEEHVHDAFFEQAFGGHPLGKPILGPRERIEKTDRETLVGYFRRHYTPERVLIAIAGDVDHEKARRILNRCLASGGSLGESRRRLPNQHRPKICPGVQMIRRDQEQAHIVAGFPSLSQHHPDRFAGYLLNVYLGGGMSSSLFQEIREKRGLAYSVYSTLAPFSDAGIFSVYVGTSAEEVHTCLSVIGREFQKLSRAAIDEDMLQILKDNINNTILMNLDSVENRMTGMAKGEMFFQDYISPKALTAAIDRVHARDVHRLARKMFQPKNLILTVLAPGKRLSASALKKTLLKEL